MLLKWRAEVSGWRTTYKRIWRTSHNFLYVVPKCWARVMRVTGDYSVVDSEAAAEIGSCFRHKQIQPEYLYVLSVFACQQYAAFTHCCPLFSFCCHSVEAHASLLQQVCYLVRVRIGGRDAGSRVVFCIRWPCILSSIQNPRYQNCTFRSI
jgi:hypothetical protein